MSERQTPEHQFVSASERFECVGSLYYQRHGRLRPGKSEPLETGRDANSDENYEQFETWLAVHAFTDAINHIVRLEREIERLSKPLHALELERLSQPLHEREPPHCPSCSCGMEAQSRGR